MTCCSKWVVKIKYRHIELVHIFYRSSAKRKKQRKRKWTRKKDWMRLTTMYFGLKLISSNSLMGIQITFFHGERKQKPNERTSKRAVKSGRGRESERENEKGEKLWLLVAVSVSFDVFRCDSFSLCTQIQRLFGNVNNNLTFSLFCLFFSFCSTTKHSN